MKVEDDVVPFALIGGTFCFIILASVGKSAGPAAWMDFIGSLLASVITILGAYFVFHLQNEATEQRHLTTIRALLQELSAAGAAMFVNDAELDPEKAVREASVAYGTALSVAAEMRASGSKIARVAERLQVASEAAEIQRLLAAEGGIAAADLHARGEEIRKLADDLLATLRGGL
jgi:hypothetical protein